MSEGTPTVTVLLMTYNHERWIAQAIDSVLMQQTDFPVEVVIIEDCSTDGTRDIVREYGRRYPDRLRLDLAERNLCSDEVWVRHLRASKARYLTILDGDDYWTSPRKLQAQVKFLAGHPKCSICFHNAREVFVERPGEEADYCSMSRPELSTIRQLLDANFIPACGRLISLPHLGGVPDWLIRAPWPDWGLSILAALNGNIGFLKHHWAVRRVHRGGEWSRLDEAEQIARDAGMYQLLLEHLPPEHHDPIRQNLARKQAQLAKLGSAT